MTPSVITTRSESKVSVVGLHGGEPAHSSARRRMVDADVLVAAQRHLDELPPSADTSQHRIRFTSLDHVIQQCRTSLERSEQICVLASGDPGFFGIVRSLATALGSDNLDVHPSPSSVSLAFARLGLPWDDATVASCHGRPIEGAVRQVRGSDKCAVLVSADASPQALGAALLDAGCSPRRIWVCARLGTASEQITSTDLHGLASGTFDPLSVVIAIADGGEVAPAPGAVWGRPIEEFDHKASLITKPEVRAVVLSKLELPTEGVVWDVGAGSGAVAIEASQLAPGTRVLAIEHDTESCARMASNAAGAAGAPRLEIVEGHAPEAFAGLADPDRVFVGGGGPEVLDAACERLASDGIAVATFAVMDSAIRAARRLGNLVQLQVQRGQPIGPDAQLRLEAENPVFIVWGTP